MRMLDKARLRLRSLFRRPNVDFELEAELRFHLDQLMDLTAESPAIGGARNALSAPEYAEFRQMNQSFAAVGAYSTGGAAYTTGEVNLTAGDRPLRVRSISVDAHLFKALSIQPEQGRFFSDEETARWTGTLPPPIAILSHELWRTAFGQ